jgi:hypothetical protein
MVMAGWALPALAQETGAGYPKIEGFAGYSGVLTNSVLIPIGPNRNGGTDLDSSTGFEGAIIKNLNRRIGLKADFSAYFGHYNEDDFPPCAQSTCPTQTAESHTRLFHILAGPEIKLRNHTRIGPFGHILAGGAHSSTNFHTAGPALNFSGSTNQTGFALALGGGLDVRIRGRIGFRLSADDGWVYNAKQANGAASVVHPFRFSLGLLFH